MTAQEIAREKVLIDIISERETMVLNQHKQIAAMTAKIKDLEAKASERAAQKGKED